jgi:hypothetical protein
MVYLRLQMLTTMIKYTAFEYLVISIWDNFPGPPVKGAPKCTKLKIKINWNVFYINNGMRKNF